jgi:hypothetical protein
MLIFDQQYNNMTAKEIEEQIIAIREATQKAMASPEAALAFLKRAGIVSADATIPAKPTAAALNGAASKKAK